MANFDFTDAAARGYEFVWRERSYILRVAIPVIFVKFTCLLAVFYFGFEENLRLTGLISLPEYVLEAILMVSLIRYYVFREPIYIWGKPIEAPPPFLENNQPSFNTRVSRDFAMKAGVGIYLLIKIIAIAFLSLTKDLAAVMEVEEAAHSMPPPNMGSFVVLLMSLWLMIWGIRLLWIFIPEALGVSWDSFLKRLGGFRVSLPIILTYLICFLPLMVLLVTLMYMATALLGEGSAASIIIASLIHAIGDVVMVSVQVVAMTCGFLEIISRKTPKS